MFHTVFSVLLFLLLLPFKVLRAFLLSPWGLIAPITLLVLIFAFRYVEQTPVQLAGFYAAQFAACEDDEIPQLVNVLLRLNDAGIDGLVQGLTNDREAVFNACRDTLQMLYEKRSNEHFCRLLSEALLKHSGQFTPMAKYEAVRFTEQMLNINKPDGSLSPETTLNCENLLARLNNTRRTMTESNRKNTKETENNASASIPAVGKRSLQPILVAANGKRFENSLPTTANNARNRENAAQYAAVDRLSVPRAERIAAFQQNGETRETEVIGSASVPAPALAAAAVKIGQNYQANDQTPDITENYRNENPTGGQGTDSFIPEELRNTLPDRVPNLPTIQLMQMLHHPNPNYVISARKTLTERDGFNETHLKLAWRLYHPSPSVRQEIIAMLPHTANVHPDVWLSVLLDDPSNEVRYQAAAFLATGSDPALQKLLIEHAKRDTDSRIIDIADRLIERQRNIRR
ncbi:MAG: HEAT repeat domain-containing protein [Planctomycetaceae bacterium]|jgi:hypothetical protein|nr:HEAT repeat domain-containing protein [Planctomycetaceae bacterium]